MRTYDGSSEVLRSDAMLTILTTRTSPLAGCCIQPSNERTPVARRTILQPVRRSGCQMKRTPMKLEMLVLIAWLLRR